MRALAFRPTASSQSVTSPNVAEPNPVWEVGHCIRRRNALLAGRRFDAASGVNRDGDDDGKRRDEVDKMPRA